MYPSVFHLFLQPTLLARAGNIAYLSSMSTYFYDMFVVHCRAFHLAVVLEQTKRTRRWTLNSSLLTRRKPRDVDRVQAGLLILTAAPTCVTKACKSPQDERALKFASPQIREPMLGNMRLCGYIFGFSSNATTGGNGWKRHPLSTSPVSRSLLRRPIYSQV